jgi:hypothetical protein
MNVFIERGAIQRWADALVMELEEIRYGGEAIVPEGSLGQSICEMRKPARTREQHARGEQAATPTRPCQARLRVAREVRFDPCRTFGRSACR